jgi:hypothetical protein
MIERKPLASEQGRSTADLPTVAFHDTTWLVTKDWPSPDWHWPSALESFFAIGVRHFVDMSESSSDWSGNSGFLRRLLNPDVPLRPMARLLLALGLNAKLPEAAGLATDALSAAIDDGRLDDQGLGKSLRVAWRLRVGIRSYGLVSDPPSGTPLSDPLVKPPRWAKALGDVARTSTLHAGVVARAVEFVLADESSASRTTASLLPLLELLKETSVETGRAISGVARAYLGGLGTGGKTGRVVKDLLALREIPNHAALHQARTRALANRIARAERWTAWEKSS